MVIDDNEAIHQDFRKILARDTVRNGALADMAAELFGQGEPATRAVDFEIDSAFQGREGLERVLQACAEQRPYAMAFVDMRMPPGWDGIETISRIWAEYPDLEVVVCTAYSDLSLEQIIQKLGDTDRMVILKKPFDMIEVTQLARALTEKWRLGQQVKRKIAILENLAEKGASELVESEERFRLIAENAADLIAVLELDGTITYRSPSFTRVLGFPLDGSQNAERCGEIHPDDCEMVAADRQEMIRTGIGRVLEYRMRHRDGSWRTFESHGNPVRNARGEVENLVVVGREITERKKAEEERRQMEVQLLHAQKMESIGQLAAGIAHEINTPTQYIGDNTLFVKEGIVELMKVLEAYGRLLQAAKEQAFSRELTEEVEATVKVADAEYLAKEIPKAIDQSLMGIRRVAKIVGAMKEFSHPGTNEKTPLDLHRAIESTITVATNEWKYVADVVTDFCGDLPAVPCLPGELNQVILNLIVNASHAIADVAGESAGGKGIITVSTRLDDEWVEIRVADTGTGIREEIRSKIFDPFFTTKGVGKGTGQGLAIAHSVVVDKHGGELQLESAVGKGSTFIIRLPLSTDAAKKKAA